MTGIYQNILKVDIGRDGFCAGQVPKLINEVFEEVDIAKLSDYYKHELVFVFDENVSEGLKRHCMDLFNSVIGENLDQRNLLDFLH